MISKVLYKDGPVILCDNNKSEMFNFSYGYLAAHLLKNNENVKIIQIDKDLIKNLMKEKPLIVGFGSIYPDLLVIKNIIAELDKVNRPFPVIIGGPMVTPIPEFAMNITNADFGIVGEGEIAFLKLIQRLRNNEHYDSIKGLLIKNKSEIINNGFGEIIEDLDTLTPIPYELFENKNWRSPGKWQKENWYNQVWNYSQKVLNVIGSRGCPYKCNFCYHSSKYRLRSIESIISEIKYYRQQINFDTIFFADDLWFLNKERINAFIRSISELDFSFHYRICARIDILSKLDDKSLKELSGSGCKTIFLGIESGSNKILNIMNKNINKQQIIEQVKRLTYFNIIPCGSIMIGQLHETLDDINETLDLVQKLIHINPLTEITFNYVTPYPGSELYDMLLTKGYIKNHLDFFNRFFSKTKNWNPLNRGEKYIELEQKYNTLKRNTRRKKKIRSIALNIYKFVNFQVRFPMRNLYDRIFINRKEMYNFENLNMYFEILMHWQPVVNISDMDNQDLFYAFQVIEKGYFKYKRQELGRTIYILEFMQYFLGYIKKKFTARLSSLSLKNVNNYYDIIQTVLDNHIWKLRNKVKEKKTTTLKIVNERNLEQQILQNEDAIKFQNVFFEYMGTSKNLVFRGFYPPVKAPLKRGGE